MTGALQDSTTQVRDVADDAVTATGDQAGTLTKSVDNGLGGLRTSLLSEETGPQPDISSIETPTPTRGAAPAVPQSSQLAEHQGSAERTTPVTERRSPEPGDSPGKPVGSRPFTLPAPPAAPGFGGTTDGQQHNNNAVGWYFAEPDRTPAFADSPTRDTARALSSAPEPQPGTTPD